MRSLPGILRAVTVLAPHWSSVRLLIFCTSLRPTLAKVCIYMSGEG